MTRDLRIGLIGGTGVGEALASGMDPRQTKSHEVDTPFGLPSDVIITGDYHGVPIAMLKRHGDGHVFNPAAVPYRANIYALKQLGCTHIVASGAAGSLREPIKPADLVVCDQLIDRTNGRVKTFFERAAVHVEFAQPFCPITRRWLIEAAKRLPDVHVHEGGCYVCMEGPSFSTVAESNLHRQWGADVVGMTALPEARLAREAEMAFALVALPTDYDCWRPRPPQEHGDFLLQEIIGNLNRATQSLLALLKAALSNVSILRNSSSPAHDALKLAIWSDKAKLDPAEVKRLELLWGRHFSQRPTR